MALIAVVAVQLGSSGHRPRPVAPSAAAGPTNTGVPPGTTLLQHIGDIRITRPNTVITAMDIHGSVKIDAPNVTIRDSIIRGGAAPTHNKCIVTDTSGRGTNFRIEDSELAPSQVNVFQNDICGFNFTAVRINSHSGVDTADIAGSDVTIIDSWLHATTSFPVDPNHGGGPTHNDGIQITAGSRIRITHNTIAGGSNAAIQITQDNGHVSDVQIDDNLLGGGSCPVRMNAKPLPHMFGIEMNANRFTGTSTNPGCDVLISRRVRLSAAGNTRVGSDKSVKIARAD